MTAQARLSRTRAVLVGAVLVKSLLWGAVALFACLILLWLAQRWLLVPEVVSSVLPAVASQRSS